MLDGLGAHFLCLPHVLGNLVVVGLVVNDRGLVHISLVVVKQFVAMLHCLSQAAVFLVVQLRKLLAAGQIKHMLCIAFVEDFGSAEQARTSTLLFAHDSPALRAVVDELVALRLTLTLATLLNGRFAARNNLDRLIILLLLLLFMLVLVLGLARHFLKN